MKEEITSLVEIRKESTEIVSFKPTPAMIVWVETAIRLGTLKPAAISKESNISRTNWSRGKWLGKEGFYDWFVNEWRKRRSHIIPQLDAIGLHHALKGDFSFWKAMNKKVGDLPDDNVPAGVSVQVNNLVEKQRDTYSLDE